MEQVDHTQGVDTYTPRSASPILRKLMWMTVIVSGFLMVAVLLSQPSMKAYVQPGLDRVETMIASFKSDKGQPQPVAAVEVTAPIADAPPADEVAADDANDGQKPSVSNMPVSRIPVNRFGIYREN